MIPRTPTPPPIFIAGLIPLADVANSKDAGYTEALQAFEQLRAGQPAYWVSVPHYANDWWLTPAQATAVKTRIDDLRCMVVATEFVDNRMKTREEKIAEAMALQQDIIAEQRIEIAQKDVKIAIDAPKVTAMVVIESSQPAQAMATVTSLLDGKLTPLGLTMQLSDQKVYIILQHLRQVKKGTRTGSTEQWQPMSNNPHLEFNFVGQLWDKDNHTMVDLMATQVRPDGITPLCNMIVKYIDEVEGQVWHPAKQKYWCVARRKK